MKYHDAAVRWDPVAFWTAIETARVARNITDRAEVARQAGLTDSTLLRLSRLGTPSLDSLIRILHWLGTTDVGPFTRPGTPTTAPAERGP